MVKERYGIQKQHFLDAYDQGARADGRAFDAYRDISVEYGVSAKSAEGSARVRIGDTEVVAGVKLSVGTPYADTSEEGTLMINVELTALAAKRFELGPPNIESIELARVIDRGIREGHAINFEKLCITPKEKVWNVIVDIYPINDGGNLFDAMALAALAALKDARFPALVDGVVDYTQRTKEKLPLGRLPVSVTVRKVGSHYFVDPTLAEEEFVEARLTVVVLEDGSFCAMQKGGDWALLASEVLAMAQLASKKARELREKLA